MSEIKNIIDKLFEAVKNKQRIERIVAVSENTWMSFCGEVGSLERENKELKSLMSVQLDMQQQIKKLESREKLLLDVIENAKEFIKSNTLNLENKSRLHKVDNATLIILLLHIDATSSDKLSEIDQTLSSVSKKLEGL